MTDTASGQTISLDPQFLNQLSSQIADFDAKLDRSSGSLTVHKNAVERDLAIKHAPQLSEEISSVVDKAGEYDDETRAAYVLMIQNQLEDAYGSEIDTLIEARAKTRAEEMTPLSEEEETEVREQRNKLNDQFKAAFNLMETWGVDLNNVQKPKIRRGPRGGTRAPRQLSRFDYTVNGMPIEKQGLNPIAQAIFGVKVKEFKAMVREADSNIDLTNAEELPDEWSVELTHPDNGELITVAATRREEFRSSESDEDNEVVADEEADEE